MLDENLPVFFLKPSVSGIKHHASIYLSHRGSTPEPAYSLQYLDPASSVQAHKNCYAAALFDAYIPDVLFGEVLVRPIWTQPTLSAEEIRRHGGIPPPPEPRIPAEFNIQLYNPDQQVPVSLKEGKWGASDTYEFSLPETTFRTPSASTLDRGQSDPAGLDITPRVLFVWKRESKFSKDLTCFMTGKSTDTERKRSRRDPDIAIALWRSMREMTIYESNLGRIDIEDPKGLEVSLLLSALVVKDFYFTSSEKVPELFNIEALNARRTSNTQQPKIPPPLPNRQLPPGQGQSSPPAQAYVTPPPPPDPREKWQIEAETVRLRVVAENEAREAQRQQRERQRAADAESKRLQKIVEQEKKEARRKAEEVERETERLKRIYGLEGQTLSPSRSSAQEQPPRRSFQGTLQSVPQGQTSPQLGSDGLPVGWSSTHVTMSGGNPNASMLNVSAPAQARKKKSFFGLRSPTNEVEAPNRLSKKQSSIW
ncbi:hypothetical protein AMS68_007659 [Peltaster fructicola]|uniref:Uncharacterized protein n=1 Tax=Peltaster fructicola TaxID=286661 RepID=A0A6H0Y528_9PEZI|nr:hypothetical protein AMS68_007659 [Peltaster fructicola]